MADSAYGWSGVRDGLMSFFTGCVPDEERFSDVETYADAAAFDAAVDAARTVPPTLAPTTITDRQFFQQLAIQGVITKDEALAAVRTGAIPVAMQALVDGLPQGQQFAAEMLISGATTFSRSSNLTAALAAAKGWTAAQVDALWTAAAAL